MKTLAVIYSGFIYAILWPNELNKKVIVTSMKLNNEMYISIFIYNSLRKYELKNIQFLNAFSSGMRMIASFIYDSLWKNG